MQSRAQETENWYLNFFWDKRTSHLKVSKKQLKKSQSAMNTYNVTIRYIQENGQHIPKSLLVKWIIVNWAM